MMGSGSRQWRPAASVEALRQRAGVLAEIRAFFRDRGVMEVSTPVLAAAGALDPQIASFRLDIDGRPHWLQSSPEFHMKRLLAAGSGPIYQIGPVFRAEEQGRWHNREFTMLEWYRPGFDHHQLMDELEALYWVLSGRSESFERWSYAALIWSHLGLDVASADAAALRQALHPALGELPANLDRSGVLDAAMGLLIGPQLGRGLPCFVFDYPRGQAALARVAGGWASRFELYWQGVELANGFHELSDAREQRRRFEADQAVRQASGLPAVSLDEALLAALQAGLPDCAGVAVGVDRLCALLAGHQSSETVLGFAAGRA